MSEFVRKAVIKEHELFYGFSETSENSWEIEFDKQFSLESKGKQWKGNVDFLSIKEFIRLQHLGTLGKIQRYIQDNRVNMDKMHDIDVRQFAEGYNRCTDEYYLS